MRKSPFACFICLIFFSTLLAAQDSGKRRMAIDDVYRMRRVGSPQVSPDGHWVAYTVTEIDKDADKRRTSLWMVNWEGTQNVRLTFGKESVSSPSWSPDGKYLSFVSSRPGKAKGSQIWLMDRRGGEARQLTQLKNYTISAYDWSPDSKKLLLVLEEKLEPDTDDAKAGSSEKPKPPKPVVIDRYHFKEDIVGYLGPKHNHIYLFDLGTEKLDQVIKDEFDETEAVW